ncbi:lipid phosphate phosphatase epsilon 2, chloroplastic-like [Andrographis paniculata]|uniref:lipid phosphate phosphatase epsilon 2, chloroplastic-like n=1 Tax=Andrographis paniculata TaxID=175694 RepID=UPI0021E9642E|nr:lipid phosphate phosphatase epsilon 2, chloroplastic-like [Andrographis paniculata]
MRNVAGSDSVGSERPITLLFFKKMSSAISVVQLPTLAAAGRREKLQQHQVGGRRVRLGFRSRKSVVLMMQIQWPWRPNYNHKTSFIGNGNPVAVGTAESDDEGIHRRFTKESLGEDDDSQAAPAPAQLEAILNSLSKWVVSIVIGAIIVWRHDAEALWAATGAVVNTVLSITLKKLFNQQRPVSTLRSDPGMPSSHAQSFFYMLTLLNVSIMERWGINLFTAILFTMFFAAASYFSWLRVSEQFHTTKQVIVGAVVGLAFSVLWFWWWYAFAVHSFTSLLWVRIMVSLGATIYVFAFVRYIIRSMFQGRDGVL